MRKTLTPVLAIAVLLSGAAKAQDWKMQPLSIPTRWAKSVSPTDALPEYPRPQLVRAQWQNLNGLWEYAITPKGGPSPAQYAGKILVPFPLESALSGVQRALKADQLLWYRRTFMVSAGPRGERTLLHLGAVDFEATVYLNGVQVGAHSGGYEHFSFDITKALKPSVNELIVRVWDPTDVGPNPHGKQGFQHTATSGIWQTVWLEQVPQAYIESLSMTPDVDHSILRLEAKLVGARPGDAVEATVRSNSTVVARRKLSGITAIHIDHPRLWSPDDPYLYDLDVQLVRGAKVVDRVTSYFGMRKIEVRADAAGIPRIFLNNRYTYNLGTLDRGWWPDGIYTAPTDTALKFDIEATKAMGFNTIRKHVKVEPDRWYYHCDKLGVLVWQDMVNPANFFPGALTQEAKAQFEQEVEETLAQLHNHPSITTWVLFNEGWGAYDQKRLAWRIKHWDPSRLLDAHTGPMDQVRAAHWSRQRDPSRAWDAGSLESFQEAANSPDWTGSDVTDRHHYPDPRMPPEEAGKARVLGEYAGAGVRIEDHIWNDLEPGYDLSYLNSSVGRLAKIYTEYVDRLKGLEAQGLSGSIYTNPFDVEGAEYGLMTYDRAVIKIPVSQITQLNSQLVPRAQNYAAATRDFSALDADATPEAQRFAALLTEYQREKRDPNFLKRMTLMAIRQKDQTHATEAGNAFIASAERPYSKEVWAFVKAVTRTSKDTGFDMLRAQAETADAVLGPNAAEIKIREVIGREEIEPSLADTSRPPPWTAIEQSVEAKYGALGKEAFSGARMMYALAHQDWPDFGRYFALYFETALPRSAYSINALSWKLCGRVDDPHALDTAIKAMQWNMEFGTAGAGKVKDDPTQHDTYACLLYKTGRRQEALTAQEEAVRLSEGRDAQINEHLAKMRAAQPTGPSPAHAAACAAKSGATFVCGPRNAEDLIAVPDSPWVIASGLADSNGLGGALYLIDRRDNSWKTLYPSAPPSNADKSSLMPGSQCTEPVDPSRFSAHGIHLREGARRLHTLYVVNHGTRESIEIFELDAVQDPKVHWKGCLILPGKAFANSVAPLPDGGLAVTVSGLTDDPRLAEKLKKGESTGYVLEWHVAEGWKQVPGSEGSFPNGIEVSPDGRWLYVTNSGNKNVVRLSRATTPVQKRVMPTNLLTDNLRWDSDGQLWVAGQQGSCGSETICAVPYEILRVDPDTFQFERVDHSPTAPQFGAGTVALPVGNEYWVGTYRGDRIARFPREVSETKMLRELKRRVEGPGEVIFRDKCASCHENSISGAPAKPALRLLTVSTIYDALTKGRMRGQAARLSGQERHQVAEYLSLRLSSDSGGHPPKRCEADANWFDKSKEPVGIGWGITAGNTRLIPAEQAGLVAADLPHLKLKWAFAFSNVSAAVAQPLAAGGALFVGSEDGTVYAFDAQSGCVHWTFKATGDILGSPVLRDAGPSHPTLFFADRLAYVYAIDAVTGVLAWRSKADDHPSATIMGTPAVVGDRIFVPVISLDETAAGPEYSCCTFRGSLLALDVATGKTLWKRYTIPAPAVERFKNALGVAQFAPSGAGLWSAPTIDTKRRLIYFTTGNSYSEPADENSDAVFAIDSASGEVKWRTQTLAHDSWTVWEYLCRTDLAKRSSPGCPSLKKPGPDIDLSTSPVLVHGSAGKDVLIAGRKDGTTFGFDPDCGKILWSTRTSANPDPTAGSLNFGIMAEGERVFVPSVGTTNFPNGAAFIPKADDGLYALDAFTGKRLWAAKVSEDCDRPTPCTGLSFAPIGFPGVVFAGATDGYVRAYHTATGKVLWRFDTAHEFKTLNGDVAKGGAIGRNSIMIANGMVYVGSGYSKLPGNVLLAFSARRESNQRRELPTTQ